LTAQQLWGHADRTIMAEAPVVPPLYARNAFLHGSNVANFFTPPYPPYPTCWWWGWPADPEASYLPT
jgi:hypothetical protein